MEAEIQKWDDMPLNVNLLRGIYAYGFENPSEIQKKAILPIIQGNDVIAQAQSGSGKTGAFTISTLQLIDTTKEETQALILAPTHELALQISKVITTIGIMMPNLVIKTLIGGTSIRDDYEQIRNKTPHIVVGSIGRVIDMFQKRYLSPDNLKLLVLDEADEMLSQGFGEKIKEMFTFYFTNQIQVVLFSATIPSEMLFITDKFMRTPIKLLMNKEDLSLKCITQYFVALQNDKMKYDTLKDLFSRISVSKCIIYCNSVLRVQELYNSMAQEGYSVCCIHSNMEKSERHAVFQQFSLGDTRVLISSDVTARGIDIQQVSTVINFDIPRSVHTYLHRIGRGGRWGRKGFAINFITRMDLGDMKKIEAHYGIHIDELPSSFSGQI
jgi:translation initiation factor 4A